MNVLLWVIVGAVLVLVAIPVSKVGLAMLMPEKAAISAHLMEELKRLNIDPHPLPDDFYTECYEFAKLMAQASPSQTKVGRRNYMALTMNMIAGLADLWISNPDDPRLHNPVAGGGFRVLFEKYTFSRISDR